MTRPMFDSKRAASIIRRHLLGELHELQLRIIMVERFGPHAVPYPAIQLKLGSISPLEELKRRHDEYVSQIERLTAAIDAASEIEWSAIVADLKQKNKK